MSDTMLAEIILVGAGVIILGLFGWVVISLRAMTTEMAQWRVTLFGMDGNNGMRGDIKELRSDIKEMRSDLLLLMGERRSGLERREG